MKPIPGTAKLITKDWLKNYLAFCLQNVQSFRDFCGQILPSYFCTIPKDRIQVRHWVQLIVFLLTLAIGFQFFLYVRQATGNGPITIARPSGVEGFLPIGALMGWKRFFTNAKWDEIHPAAMVIFGYAMVISFLFHKAFCSWFCPVGTLSEWLWRFGNRYMGHNVILPKWLDYPLRLIKYLLLGFFVWVIFRLSASAISSFIQSPYYKISDVKMLRFFTHMTVTTGIVLVVLVMGSIFIKNFWCRYFCPYGALTGILGMMGPSKIRRNPETCINCSKCTEVCPHLLPVERKIAVLSPECSACMDCVESCPVKGTLIFSTGGKSLQKKWSTVSIGAVSITLFWCLFYLSSISGIWESQLPEAEFRELLQVIDSPSLTHPRVG